MERDAHWFRMVRRVKLPNGDVRFVLSRQPTKSRVQYESIVPLAFGGGHMGAVAYREGCGTLLHADGTPVVAEAFSTIETDSYFEHPSEPRVRYRLIYADTTGSDHAYAVFTNGRLSAVSSRRYVRERSVIHSDHTSDAAGNLAIVEVESGAKGVIHKWTLREILQSEWRRIDSFALDSSRVGGKTTVPPLYFIATKEESQVFAHDGTSIPLEKFDELGRIGNLFLPVREPGGPDPITIFALDKQAKTCRLYSALFRPLIDEPIPVSRNPSGPRWDVCDLTRWWGKKHFAFTGADGKTRLYQKRLIGSEGLLIKVADVAAELVFSYEDGSMLLKSPETALPYWLMNAQGEAVPGARFEAVKALVCGGWLVKRNDDWWHLRTDGTLMAPTYRFSC